MGRKMGHANEEYEFRAGHKHFKGTEPPTTELQRTLSDPIRSIKDGGAGKGDARRQATNEQRLAENWCRALGHKFRHGICMNGCGTTKAN